MENREIQHTISYEDRLHKALINFHQFLFDNQSKQIKKDLIEFTDCPVCHSKQSKEVFIKDFFHYHRCLNCSMLYMNPRLSAEATKSFYNSEVNKIYNEKKFDEVNLSTEVDDATNIENVHFLVDFLRRNKIDGRKLLEVGCAKGVFLKGAQSAGFEVEGLELNFENSQIANRLIEGGVHAVDLFDMKYPAGSFDIVYMRDVIEHIHNPDPFLAEVSRILKPGGVIYLETHNIDGLIYKIVGGKHTVIFGFEHPVHWSPKTLALALSKHQMSVKLVKFKSLDFLLRVIVQYYLRPTFTTVFPWKVNPVRRFLLRGFNFILNRPAIKQLDELIFPKLANAFHAGSTMKVIGVKQEKKG